MTGKTNVLQMIYHMAANKGNVYYIDLTGNMLHLPEYENACIIRDLDGMYQMCESLIPILKERNKKKKALEEEDYTAEEIFANMADEIPIFILIDGLTEFLEKLQFSQFLPQNMLLLSCPSFQPHPPAAKSQFFPVYIYKVFLASVPYICTSMAFYSVFCLFRKILNLKTLFYYFPFFSSNLFTTSPYTLSTVIPGIPK